MSNEHVRESAVAVATGKRPIAPTVKKAAKAEPATKSTKPTTVTLRRSAGGGGVPKGHFVLIINPSVFGSSDGSNWLGGKSYATKELALAAATKAGAKLAS